MLRQNSNENLNHDNFLNQVYHNKSNNINNNINPSSYVNVSNSSVKNVKGIFNITKFI